MQRQHERSPSDAQRDKLRSAFFPPRARMGSTSRRRPRLGSLPREQKKKAHGRRPPSRAVGYYQSFSGFKLGFAVKGAKSPRTSPRRLQAPRAVALKISCHAPKNHLTLPRCEPRHSGRGQHPGDRQRQRLPPRAAACPGMEYTAARLAASLDEKGRGFGGVRGGGHEAAVLGGGGGETERQRERHTERERERDKVEQNGTK